MSCHGFVVAGTQTGVGKTTLAVGLMRAYRDRGETVQPFKVGPDFIDPTHHRAAAGESSHNLDGWMLDRATNRELFRRRASEADVAIVEGVMGLFDGAEGSSDRGSTAEMARWLEMPVLLVVDAWKLGGSVAPIVAGFAEFDAELDVAGVVLNRVTGPRHADMLRASLERVDGVDVLGAVPADDKLEIPERHLGLELSGESGLSEARMQACGARIGEEVDLEAVYNRAVRVEPPASSGRSRTRSNVRIGVATDAAFQFYYRENLDRLESAGAELIEFSPVAGEWPDRLDGLYLGGGYPELAAEELSARGDWFAALRKFSRSGGPVYAECGGLMVLGEAVETTEGETFEMAGVFPWTTRISERPHLDYAEVEVTEGSPLFDSRSLRGHFFHYSRMVDEPASGDFRRVYDVEPERGDAVREGYLLRRTLASYIHLHFASDGGAARSFVRTCRAFREESRR